MRKEFLVLGAIVIAVVALAYFGSVYYRGNVQNERKPVNTPNANMIREDSPTLGPADAKVTIVEFLDPECESCAAFAPSVKKILKDFDGKTRLVIRYMTFHPNSVTAGNFLEAAGEQGKYWQAQELIFAKQSEWGEKHGAPPTSQPDVKAQFVKFTQELGLDQEKVDAAIRENRFGPKFERDKRDGTSLGVRQTPTIFVNGRRLARLYEADLRALIEDELRN